MTLTLTTKIHHAYARLQHLLEEVGSANPIAVAWTGGKDSTVALHLWRQVLTDTSQLAVMPTIALHVDTGRKFPEVLAFRDALAVTWELNMYIVSPEVNSVYFSPEADPIACCTALKIIPLKIALAKHGIIALITGLRADEHPSRVSRFWREPQTAPPHLRYHPILDFTEMDVWAYIFERGLPYCSLYDQGYRSLGCRPCTSPYGETERAGRAPEKEKMLSHLHSLGYF